MIYLVRHGETEFNRERRAQGLLDSPLTDLGIEQARRMAELLADLVAIDPGPWRIVASPLGRTRQTAAIIAERLGLPIAYDDRLREHSMGEFDGMLVSEILPRLPPDVPRHERHHHAPGAESYEEISARIASFMAGIGADDRVILVSHGHAGRIIRGLHGGLDREQTLSLDAPQDVVFRLLHGQVDRFDCEPID